MSVCSVGPARRSPGTSVTRGCGAVDARSSDLASCQGLPWPLSLLQILRVSCSGSCPIPGSIPGSGRSSGEGTRYPLQYSWASLVAQLVKNPPAMRETWIRFLGREDPLEKGKTTHSSILAWSHGIAKSQTRLSDFHLTHCSRSRRPATFSPPPPPLRAARPCR